MPTQTDISAFGPVWGPPALFGTRAGLLFYILEAEKMNELVKVTESGGRPGVNARDLHERLGVGRQFSHWIQECIKKFGLMEGQDYKTCKPNLASEFSMHGSQYQKSQSPNLATGADESRSPNLASEFSMHGGQNRIDYILSIQAAMLIASGENSPAGVAIAKALANQVGQTIENHAQLAALVQMEVQAAIGRYGEDLHLLEKRHDDLEDSVKRHVHYVENGLKKMVEECRFKDQRALDRFMAMALDMTGGRTLVLDAYRIYLEKYNGNLSLHDFGIDVPFRNVHIHLIYAEEGAIWTGCRLRGKAY
jgi:hypothetical protein